MIKKANKSIAVFVLLSLFIHVFSVVILGLKRAPRKPTERIEVEYKTEPDLIPPPTDTKGAKRKQVDAARDQIVEQKKQINDEVDEKTRFLSAFNQRVVKQTRADKSGKFNNEAKGGKKAEGTKEGDKQALQNDKDNREKPRERGDLPDLKQLTPKFSIDPGSSGQQADKNGSPSATDDYLKDVQSGMQTLLSTREFVYYSYYNRIKEALRQYWEPDVREKVKIIYRQGRSIASARDRVTQVLVTLDRNGELLRIEVLTQSGVQDLDNAAVDAFREAAPFPNPPKGMVETDGTIKIRWDFVLEV